MSVEQPFRTEALGRIERRVAERLAESRRTIPDFTVELDIDATGLIPALKGIDAEPRPTLNDAILWACGRALVAHERLRARFVEDAIQIAESTDVGFAVALDGGLVAPVVRAAGERSPAEIAAETRRLSAAARAGTISAADMLGGVFTVSNLGMFGITRFQAVIDPSQGAIMSVGTIREELVRRDGEIVDVQRIALAVSADHRVVDGAQASRFLADVRTSLEDPDALLGASA